MSFRYCARRGRIIALIGIDGAGKSTLSREIGRELTHKGIRIKRVWGGFKDWRLLKFLSTLIKSCTSLDGRPIEVGSEPGLPENRFILYLYYLAVVADYSVQMFLRVIFPRIEGFTVISDRYYHDIAITFSLGLGRKSVSGAFMRLLSWILPEPDVTILVMTNPATAYSRKRDIPSYDWVSMRHPLYLELARSRGYMIVNGEAPASENSSLVVSMILKER